MSRWPSIFFAAALLVTADVPGATPLRPATKVPVNLPPADDLPLLPDLSSADNHPASDVPDGAANAAAPSANSRLTEQSRLMLVRSVDFEFAKVVEPIPAGKDGFHLKAGEAPDRTQLQKALTFGGAAVNPGDTAQITNLTFKEREIVVDINGGGRGKQRLRDHIHMETAGIPSVQVYDPTQTTSVAPKVGATLVLEFDRPLPDMTPQDLEKYLSSMLDFTKAHSAAEQWIDTLPPDIRQAIKDRRAVVGMDRDMVLTAIGRPDRKVRERDNDGNETEDWIYGQPPAQTIFVTFAGDKVVKVEQFPN